MLGCLGLCRTVLTGSALISALMNADHEVGFWLVLKQDAT
jgi:hypothetical protein